eukprot:TRINITY_DN37448_c0_g1_i2.p1 TRINITY_DN37448_c0_g1~~TRINITY_DN37448_c0_g1_i2.p1  ORF type:complete len:337 (-),score=19.17 TRINITY_DN37448_c0_g1_i2:23-1033(-)
MRGTFLEVKSGALLFVELDILAKRRGVPSYTCVHNPIQERGTYLNHAKLTRRFGLAYDVEMADFGDVARGPRESHVGRTLTEHQQDLCPDIWHASFEERRSLFVESYDLVQSGMASRPCHRVNLQKHAIQAMKWWLELDSERHMVLPVQGTLLTTLVRGGEVAVMPWDIDLEFVFASTGPNPIIAACESKVATGWTHFLTCLETEVGNGIGLFDVRASPTTVYIPEMMHRNKGVLAKIRLEIHEFDITLDSYLDPKDLLKARLLGVDVHFAWDQWEYQFFEIYGGDLTKKVGTSGTVNKTSQCDDSANHTACLLSTCHGSHSFGCTLELPDWFSHV